MTWNISRVGSALVTIIAIGATVWYNFPVGSMAAKQLFGGILPVNPQQNDLELQQLGEFAVNTHNSAAVSAWPQSGVLAASVLTSWATKSY